MRTKQQDNERKRIKYHTDPEYKKRENERAAKWAATHKSHLKAYYKEFREKETLKWKTMVYDLLGRKCAHCGYDADSRALQVDHIDGGGRQHQRKHSNYTFYKDVIKANGVGFQILCANCNTIKSFENKERHGKHIRT